MKTEQEIREQIAWEENRQKDAIKYDCKAIMFQCEGSLWALHWVLNEPKEVLNDVN